MSYDQNQKRTSCPLCDNNGLVYVWSNLTLREVLHGKDNRNQVIEREPRMTDAAIACSCFHGDRFASTHKLRDNQPTQNPRYDPDSYCLKGQDVHEWQTTRKPAGYVDAFDDFNKGKG